MPALPPECLAHGFDFSSATCAAACLNNPSECIDYVVPYCSQGENVTNAFCQDFIGRNHASYASRLDDLMLNYCNRGTNMVKDVCYNYYAKFKPAGWTDALTNYCRSQGATIETMANNRGNFDAHTFNLCVCNMPTTEYIKLETALRQQVYPLLEGVSLGDPRCLFPGCAASPSFQPENLKCPPISCIQAININASGTIGPISIDQKIQCGQGGGGTPAPTATPKPQHRGLTGVEIALIVLGIVIVLGIIAAAVFAGRAHQKKATAPATHTTSETHSDGFAVTDVH